jgi:hypothetical protein
MYSCLGLRAFSGSAVGSTETEITSHNFLLGLQGQNTDTACGGVLFGRHRFYLEFSFLAFLISSKKILLHSHASRRKNHGRHLTILKNVAFFCGTVRCGTIPAALPKLASPWQQEQRR